MGIYGYSEISQGINAYIEARQSFSLMQKSGSIIHISALKKLPYIGWPCRSLFRSETGSPI
jgi:hypothetical protein